MYAYVIDTLCRICEIFGFFANELYTSKVHGRVHHKNVTAYP